MASGESATSPTQETTPQKIDTRKGDLSPADGAAGNTDGARAGMSVDVQPAENFPVRRHRASVSELVIHTSSSPMYLAAWNRKFGGNDNDNIGTVVSMATPTSKLKSGGTVR